MTLVEDYVLNSRERTLLLLILSVDDCNHERAMDKLRIQYVIGLFEQFCQRKIVDFSSFKLRRVLGELEENIDALVEYGLVVETNGLFVLTPEGEKGASLLKHSFDVDEFEKLVYAKQLLNDLPIDELLYFMYKTMSETQKCPAEFSRLERKAESLVKSLFLKRKIDAVTAAKWLNISVDTFGKKISKKTLPVETQQRLIEGYQQSADEDLAIAKEFEPMDHEFGYEYNNP